jgi:phytoene/squalene synthetase
VVADPRLDDAARVVADRARAHFGEANRIMAARPRGHLIAPRLMERVYAGVLARMEIAGWRPPRRRARVDKLGLLLTLVRLQLTR